MLVDVLLTSVVSIAFVGMVGVLALRARHAWRVARLEAWAARQGWSYAEFDPSVAERYTWGPFKSYGAYAHVIRGDHRDRSFTAFEHHYGELSVGPPLQRTYQVVAVAVPDVVDLPQSSLTELFSAASWAREGSVRLADGELVGWVERSLEPEGCASMLNDLVDIANRLPSR